MRVSTAMTVCAAVAMDLAIAVSGLCKELSYSHKHVSSTLFTPPSISSPSTTYLCSRLASMILHVKRARPRSGRPRFSFSSAFLCTLRQCHTQDTQLYFFVLCLYFLSLQHQRYDLTNSISTTTSTKNQSATEVSDYAGAWTDHTYFPSPSNWRIPFYTLFLDKFVNGDPTNDDINGTMFEHDVT